MIPKIAHFHWEGEPINWLRMMGIYTFARLNPRWDVRLMRTPAHIRRVGLPHYCQEADWAWAEALCEFGGFSWGTDTVFVRPVPDEWCEADMCACTNGGKSFFHGAVGSVPGTDFLKSYVESCRSLPTHDLDYQSYGTVMMNKIASDMGGVDMVHNGLSFVDMPVDAMTPVRWHDPARVWKEEPLNLPDDTIGVHWYGGAPCSRSREWDVPAKHGNAAIVKLAIEVTGGL